MLLVAGELRFVDVFQVWIVDKVCGAGAGSGVGSGSNRVAIRVEFVKGDSHARAGVGAGIKRGGDATFSVKVYFAGTFDALDHDFGVPFMGTGASPLVDWYPAVVRSRGGVGVSNAVEGCIEYAVPMGVRVVFVKGGTYGDSGGRTRAFVPLVQVRIGRTRAAEGVFGRGARVILVGIKVNASTAVGVTFENGTMDLLERTPVSACERP